MARITVEDCLEKYLMGLINHYGIKRARHVTTSREPLVEWDNDKPTIVALREIEEGLLDNDTLEEWLKDDILSDGFGRTS